MSKPVKLSQHERRIWPRIRLDRSSKVYDVTARKYVVATTRNVSQGGALLEVVRHFSLAPGDPIELGVPTPDQALMPGDALLEAVVLRSTRMQGDRMMLAVRFAVPSENVEPVVAQAA